MPAVIDPSKLTYVGTPDIRLAENDLFRAWHAMANELGPVARRRVLRARYFRVRYRNAVKV